MRHFTARFASFYRVKWVRLSSEMRQITRWFAVFYFTFHYQQHHHSLLTSKQLPPFPRLITPLSLRRTIGRCSWSLRNEESKGLGVRLYLPYTIVPFIINHAAPIIVSSRNSVRVVLLIARGWRGTSLPRVNVRKEIQRRRCWAFSVKSRLQWTLLWRITPKKRNTYGVAPHTTYANPG